MDPNFENDELLRRCYHLEGDEDGELIVSIKRPLRDAKGPYRCRYEIVGLGQNRKHEIQGSDAIHALLNAFSLIGSWLKGVDETEYAGRLRWAGGTPGDIGFPTVEDHWPTGPL
jgi:hypothetical protein